MLKFAAFFIFTALLAGAFFGSFAAQAAASATPSSATPSATPSAESLVTRALDMHLDESEQWRRLVHYRKTWFGWESEADNALFFVAKEGRKNPRAELSETLRVGVANTPLPVAMPGADSMSVRCQYPARWKWLLKSLDVPLSSFPLEGCAKYDEYLRKEKPASVTFVFSGFFVDNPSSSFGHVLIRLNRVVHTGEISTGAELLDYGVGYAANATTGNPILYTIGGFAGWFPSTFSSLPFYYKVREYSDAESRDLWEYDLNLSPEEVERLADHLWELGSTYFNYYYLRENCAYHLLALLEAAAPRLHLLNRTPYFVIPVDTVKSVTQEPGLVGRVQYRPSTARILRARLALLTPSELDLFYAIRNEPKPAELLGDVDKASSSRVLDAVLDDIDYHHFRDLVFKSNPAAAARKQNVLLARAQLPMSPEVKVQVTEEDRPDRSHGSFRWWLGVGQQTNLPGADSVPDRSANDARSIVDGELRFALHDIHDPLDGYLQYSSVEFWRMRGRFDARSSRTELESFSLFTISSLSPISRLEAKPAWRVNIGLERVRDRRCDGCLAPTGQVYGGGSIEPLRGILLYTIAGPRGESSSAFLKEKWLASGTLLGGARFKLSHEFQVAFEAEWRRVFDRETFDRVSGEGRMRWDHVTGSLQSPIALEVVVEAEPLMQTALLRLVSYF